MALSTHAKGKLDNMHPGMASVMVAAINSGTTTPFTRDIRDKLAHILGGIGEATAFITAISSQGTISQAAKLRLVNYLHGQGEFEAFQTAVTGQSA